MPGCYRALTETTNVAHSAPSHRTALHNQKVIGSNRISDSTSQQLNVAKGTGLNCIQQNPLYSVAVPSQGNEI